jgi:hypothetical protein
MQEFSARLTRPLNGEQFCAKWDEQVELFAPAVQFVFYGNCVSARVISGGRWDSGNFRQAFTMIVHRLDPHCDVIWN